MLPVVPASAGKPAPTVTVSQQWNSDCSVTVRVAWRGFAGRVHGIVQSEEYLFYAGVSEGPLSNGKHGSYSHTFQWPASSDGPHPWRALGWLTDANGDFIVNNGAIYVYDPPGNGTATVAVSCAVTRI